ncbi:hypothetical protein GGTG_03842 [Gaeumannomyces tritici R3-111a-1]|uniref:Uncharacterized protein n=1 Tax=Gaeumannomyces tritici (strain R3-111a-1) TaxID=644352 RepID=J3NRD8_GAET3|nr:hypothetical protein GGTG_03842 [Gaeumannomyces tritici R3-111a-1]EJT78744.1 hypothetical protein GGTG_03842 [Gaeumannomyces tritici R3-111a-1]
MVQLPLTEPKVSSAEASVWDLGQWEFNWVAWARAARRGAGQPGVCYVWIFEL